MNFNMDITEEDIIEFKNICHDIDEAIKEFYINGKGDLSKYSTTILYNKPKNEDMIRTIYYYAPGYREIAESLNIDDRYNPDIDKRLKEILTYEEFRYTQFSFILEYRCLNRFSIEQILGYTKEETKIIHRSMFDKIKKDKRIRQIVRISNRDTSEDLDCELAKSINSMDISERSYNVLRKAGIKYVYDVSKMSISEIRKIKGAGNKVVDEIVQCMINDYGCSLKD